MGSHCTKTQTRTSFLEPVTLDASCNMRFASLLHISGQHFFIDFDISSSRLEWIPCPDPEFEEENKPLQRQASEAYLEVSGGFCAAP